MTTTTKRPRGARTKLRPSVADLLALDFPLLSVGMLFTACAPQAQTASAQQQDALVRPGEQIYLNTCLSCHGESLQGAKDRGPSLVGVGDAAVYFQTSSGR